MHEISKMVPRCSYLDTTSVAQFNPSSRSVLHYKQQPRKYRKGTRSYFTIVKFMMK